MKNIILATISLLIISCHHSEDTTNSIKDTSELDSIISKSNETFTNVSQANEKSDSLVIGKIDNTVKKIDHLETQVKELKKENNELKAKLDDIDDAGQPYSIRSISSN
jgi:septal ring factor EnvC (AmiA/AmiB activator)